MNYASHLVEDSSTGDVLIYMPNGRQDQFTFNETDYDRPYKIITSLTKVDTDHFELRFPDDKVYTYQIPTDSGLTYPVMTELRNAYGQALTFTYDSSAQLTTITDAVGNVTSLTYTDGQVTRVDDPFGRYAEFRYDADGDLIRIVDMGGYWSEMTYDTDSYIASLTNERGTTGFYIEPRSDTTTTSTFPEPGEAMQEHYRITVTHPDGNKSQYFYSGMTGTSWYVSPRDYVEYENTYVNNNAEDVPKTVYTYATTTIGDREEIASIVTPEGKITSYTYDYDTGHILSVTDTMGSTASYTYNDIGRVTSVTPEVGAVTNYVYDTDNNFDLTEIQKVGLGSVIIGYNAYHQPTSYEDMSGNTTQITYNANGQMENRTITVNGEQIDTSYTYYGSDESSPNYLKEILQNSEIIAQFTYDAVGRLSQFTDADGYALIYTYDNLNQITQIDYPDAKSIVNVYSGCCPFLMDSTTDRNGGTTSYTYDANRRLIGIVDPDNKQTRFEYDANGNQIQLIDANNQTTRFEYDLDNRLVRKIFADGQAVAYQYNTNGLPSKRVDARGITAQYSYDGNHRWIGVDYSDNTPSVSYLYDDYGRITQMTDGLGTTSYTYDTNSNVLSVDGPWLDDTLTYQYDELNRRTHITPLIGRATVYSYDALGRLTQVQSGTDDFGYTFKSAASHLVDQLTRPSGSYTNYSYNANKQLTTIDNKNSSDVTITSNTFTYNDLDMIGSETLTANDLMAGFEQGLTTYNYNSVNQLLAIDNPSQTFDYDYDGNMINGYTPDGYQYAATYDGENRLISIEYTDSGSVVHKVEFGYHVLNPALF
jgi:YD repeat-containing protein